MGSVVFAKSPGPADQHKSIRLSSLIHDLFVGLEYLGAFAFKPPRVEKSLRELSRGRAFPEALVGEASVNVKYQKTGKTSWTTSCFENL